MSFVSNQIREAGFIHGLLDDAADEIESLEAQLASAPAWHDAPTCAGLWWVAGTAGVFHIDEAALSIYKGSAHRWYGPIPPDSGDKK